MYIYIYIYVYVHIYIYIFYIGPSASTRSCTRPPWTATSAGGTASATPPTSSTR